VGRSGLVGPLEPGHFSDAMRPPLPLLLRRAVKLRCPRCGEGPIFRRVLTYKEYESCLRCGFRYDPRGESLAFMYFSTAFLTGLLIIVMLLTRPENLVVGRFFVVGAALGLYLVTMPLRKAIAIAINYLHAGEEGR
jgi:uncharacterized protein (DUF983 family)